ncbi:ATP-dependent helicase [Nitrosomonas communis]|uniref:DNA 3'-5' helicase II n=1 Tax=Nitrosomonas communis TaxID=44574 RepID=A0A1I4S3Z8_9PROT|nr:ATP-dependent helicase [Nitrosomonas communis]SFM59236.1 DNA helicase-2 / ATP-dependent DNA helicase PcrA [Nitrosomonas communis]
MSATTALQSNANPQQLEAIQATDGPVLIIAGPGSGKTFTLVERIVYLIKHRGAVPESLFVVTFTEKAARELATRISNRLNELRIKFNLNEMYLGTFHSICLRLLEEYQEFTRLKRSFTLIDQFDQQYFMYQRINEFRSIADAQLIMGDDQKGRWSQSEQLMKWLNKVSDEALGIVELALAPDPEVRALAACFKKYQELMLENNYLDFSGIQYEALKLLQQHSEVLEQVQAKLSYLMVDEYQDTNTIQEKILTLLMGTKKNLCVVGDDDQGLYRFRGATIRNILEFPELFAEGECKRITLSKNYRSHPCIIEFYNWWMQGQIWEVDNKRFRFDKIIEPRDDEFPHTAAVVRLGTSDAQDSITSWHAEVLTFLHTLREKGDLSDWNQVAFLFRSVKSDRAVSLAQFLEINGVPVYSPRSNLYFDREEIRLMIGALIFLFPQFPKVRQWSEGVYLDIWKYYDQHCFKPFTEELRKPDNKRLLDWARPLAKCHIGLIQNTDYAFSGLFYQYYSFHYSVDILPKRQCEVWTKVVPHIILQLSQSYLPNLNTFTM